MRPQGQQSPPGISRRLYMHLYYIFVLYIGNITVTGINTCTYIYVYCCTAYLYRYMLSLSLPVYLFIS